ncbi:16326_t:CDS:2, partial [Gigaspora rosea]
FTIEHVFVNAINDSYKCIECQKPPTKCNQTCNDDQVCILTERTCSKCPEWSCQPKNIPNVECNECPTPKCDNTNSTDY